MNHNNVNNEAFVISGTFYTSIKNLKLNNFSLSKSYRSEESSNRFCNIDEPIDFEIAKKLAENQECVVL